MCLEQFEGARPSKTIFDRFEINADGKVLTEIKVQTFSKPCECLIVAAIDQDPYFRTVRQVARDRFKTTITSCNLQFFFTIIAECK